jgi:membrane protease YdiL (CAAX protease family)
MSIAPILAAATQPAASRVAEIAGWTVLILLLPGLAAAVYLRVYRPARVSGPLRIPPGRPVWPLVVAWLGGGAVWMGSSTAYVAFKQYQLMRVAGPQARFEESMLSAADWAIVATIPPTLGFITLLAGDFLFHFEAPAWLGFLDRRRLGRGVRAGLLGALIAVPWTIVGGGLLERVYQHTGYQHPTEHELLRKMKSAPSPAVEWTLVLGAVVVAPLFEELLFRGHLQTLIRRGLVMLTHPRHSRDGPEDLPPPVPYAPAGAPPNSVPYPPDRAVSSPSPISPPPASLPPVASPPGATCVLQYPSAPTPLPACSNPPPEAIVWQTWTAIALTSLVFALVHPLWMAPIIFFLSLCLGYAYERTGSLWTSITMHALFNLLNTLLYLSL